MPRQTYGPEPKKRVKRLLEALLCFADKEFEDSNFKIKYDWKEEDSANPKLTVQTTLVTLEFLTQKDKYPGKLTKAQIREALNLLKDFLKILEDCRIQTQGFEDWHFILKLWSRDREKNLKRFDETWENSRPKKSKELAATPKIKLALFQAPPLPEHFVKRPEYSNDLKTRLLASSSGNHTLVITAIHGLGSVGKSTIAAALAHNAEIQTRFCDGILWTTLGQQPDVLSLLSGWVQALGDCNFKPTSIEATSTHLRTLLYDKAVLVVVDDAWNTKDALVFNIGGVRCQVLVTTREGAIADALGASTYSLDIMTASQAMELLTKKLGREITGKEHESAENLAKGVGYLPLALELAAAEIADGTTWTVLLRDIQQEIARLKTLDRPGANDITDEASSKRLSLTASLNLSIKRLVQEDKKYFTWLGVLPEDVTINPKMTATLWDIADERDASDSLKDLQSKALLLPGVPLADGTPTYRLHDLFHDLAQKLPEVLPEALAAARAIQDKYYHVKALSALAQKLPEVLPEALAAARAIQSENSRAYALSALAQKLPEVLSEALAAARAIQSESDRAYALSALAQKLPEVLPEVLPEALAAARAIQSENSRAYALSALASGLSQMPSTELFPLWQYTLHELSLRTRPNLLQDIKALFPVIFALGGEAATAEVARAIGDVARWWK
ncbi:MAG: NB-ARC domain-containing protein [Nostoc sp.]|uniref:NB-ARC domain-containing protein n=1 Tax=Nostoc sp. TaxID=1180 RepID=UPI002FFCC469